MNQLWLASKMATPPMRNPCPPPPLPGPATMVHTEVVPVDHVAGPGRDAQEEPAASESEVCVPVCVSECVRIGEEDRHVQVSQECVACLTPIAGW